MNAWTRFALPLALGSILGLSDAGGAVQAFSELDFGDSSEVVSSKLRKKLDEGAFARECYKCPVRVEIGRHHFDVATEFHEDRLWRVSLRHELTANDPGTSTLEAPWQLLRDVVATRYPEPRLAPGRFPELPDGVEVHDDLEVVTDTWIVESKRLDLSLSIAVEERESERTLRERILSGWMLGNDPQLEKVVTYAVEIHVTSTDWSPGEPGPGTPASPKELERASLLF